MVLCTLNKWVEYASDLLRLLMPPMVDFIKAMKILNTSWNMYFF